MIYDILNYLIIFFIIFLFYTKNFLSVNDLIIYSFFLATPFFFNDVIIDWTSFFDQIKYVNTSNYIREKIFSWNFPYPELAPEKDLKVYLSSLVFSFIPIISFNTINSVAFCSKGIYLLSLIFLNYKKKIPFILKIYFLFSPVILFYSSLSLRDLLILSVMLLSFYFLITRDFKIKIFLILSVLFIIKIQYFFLVIIVFLGHFFLANIFRYNLNKFLIISLLMFSLLFLFDYIILDNRFLSHLEIYRMGFFAEISNYTDPEWKLKYDYYYKLEFSYSQIFLVLKSFIVAIFFPIFSDLNLFYMFFSFLDLVFTLFLFSFFFYPTDSKNKANNIYWLLVALISIFLISLTNFNEITITRYKFPILAFILYCRWLTSQKINNK